MQSRLLSTLCILLIWGLNASIHSSFLHQALDFGSGRERGARRRVGDEEESA